MNVLDLFSGIGGFSLGLEWAGFKTVAFCEPDKYCRKILRKHWPDAKIYLDIKTLTKKRLDRDRIPSVDIITGGFPCQDISTAGKREGIGAPRSGLWTEFARLLGEVRPRYAIIENVSGLRGFGLEKVLSDLSSIGFDAQWHCIPASTIGAPHQRDRIWIIAYTHGRRCHPGCECTGREEGVDAGGGSRSGREKGLADSDKLNDDSGRFGTGKICGKQPQKTVLSTSKQIISDTESNFPHGCREEGPGWGELTDTHRWLTEPPVCGVADGFPGRVDQLRGLGNAIVPQMAEMIGKAIMEL